MPIRMQINKISIRNTLTIKHFLSIQKEGEEAEETLQEASYFDDDSLREILIQ